MASSRFSPECLPSILVYDMDASLSNDSTKSRVNVQ